MNTRLILTIIIAAHGIGHILGLIIIPLGMLKETGFNHTSWLLSDKLGLNTNTVKAIGVLWVAAVAAFLAAAYGYYYDLAWWHNAVKLSVALSVALFIGWWDAFPVNVPLQANLGNLLALLTLYLNV